MSEYKNYKLLPTDANGKELVSYDDIKQQTLGDCYFLSACSATASRPGTVDRLFF
jgi:hypothetical protein